MSTPPHTPGYSRRSHEIAPFHVMSLLARAQALEQAGHDVIHLEIGEPDFTTAEPVVRAGQAALAAGHTRYTAARGLPALRQAISGFYRSHYGLDVDPERILVTPGGSGALLLASSLLVDPGRHWLLADPGYPCNRHFLRLVEGGAQLVPVGPDTAYQLTPSLVEQHWNDDSVGALVASPANPTGTVLSADELAALSQALHARGGHLVVDEIYHGLTYGLDAPSVLQVDDSAFVLNSFSKYFGMTGWRLGWLVAPPAAVPDLEKLAQNLYISASSIAQHAALACFSEESMAIFEQRREAFRHAATSCCPRCVSSASALKSSRRARSTCTPMSARSPTTRRRSARTSWKPSTWRSPRAWISASIAPTSMCGWRIPSKYRGCRRRWRGSHAG